jgi:hypothetical protein
VEIHRTVSSVRSSLKTQQSDIRSLLFSSPDRGVSTDLVVVRAGDDHSRDSPLCGADTDDTSSNELTGLCGPVVSKLINALFLGWNILEVPLGEQHVRVCTEGRLTGNRLHDPPNPMATVLIIITPPMRTFLENRIFVDTLIFLTRSHSSLLAFRPFINRTPVSADFLVLSNQRSVARSSYVLVCDRY